MENFIKLKYVLFGVLVLFISCTTNQKREIDEKEFCNHLDSFAKELDNLLVAYEGDDIDAFNKAFEKADNGWNRLVESAEKLENIQMEQSVNEYNKLVTKVNKIAADPNNTEAFDEIDGNIQKTAEKIADIQTTVCK